MKGQFRAFKNFVTQIPKVREVSDIFKTLGISGDIKINLRGGRFLILSLILKLGPLPIQEEMGIVLNSKPTF